jgi:hypothetical protein
MFYIHKLYAVELLSRTKEENFFVSLSMLLRFSYLLAEDNNCVDCCIIHNEWLRASKLLALPVSFKTIE